MSHSQSFLPFLHLFYDYLVSFRYTSFFSLSGFFSISIPLFVDCHSFYYCCHSHWIVYIKYNPKTAGNYFLFDAIFRCLYPFSGFCFPFWPFVFLSALAQAQLCTVCLALVLEHKCVWQLLWNGWCHIIHIEMEEEKKAPNAKIIYQFLELYELLCDYKTVYWRRFDCSKMRLVFITGPFIITIIQSCVSFTTHDALFYVNICFCHVHVLLIVCPVNCTEKKCSFFLKNP